MKHHDFPPRQQWHALECRCRTCVPSQIDDADWQFVGTVAFTATIVTLVVLMAIDPSGVLEALKSMLTARWHGR